jgi:single-stranded DNA-specific DHH superfamily exonuclease
MSGGYYKRMEMPQANEEKTKIREEIKNYLKDNLKMSWDFRNGKYYIVLELGGEKITDLCFGEGY